jgi:hypothetical protein
MERDHNHLDQSGMGCQGNVTKYYSNRYTERMRESVEEAE